MEGKQLNELEEKESAYLQMVNLHPSEPKYLRRLVELLLQLEKHAEAVKRMRQLESLYKKRGENDLAQSLKDLRHSISSGDDSVPTGKKSFVSGVSAEAMQMLTRNAERLFLNENDILIRQDDTDDSMYIILNGELAVLVMYGNQKNMTLIHMLKEGDIVGEMAFLDGDARSANIIANTKASVLKLSLKRVLQCLLKFPDMGAYLRKESEFRNHLIAIHANPTLAKLSNDAKEALAECAKIEHYPAFSVICQAENKLAWVGVLLSGLVRLVAEDIAGHSHVLEPIKVGSMIADIAVLQEGAITADIVAVNDAEVLQIPVQQFKAVMQENPFIKNRLIENHAKRISPTTIYTRTKN